MIFVEDEVGVFGSVTVWSDLACVNRTLGIREKALTYKREESVE